MMLFFDRALTITQVAVLAVSLEPAKSKEELVARLVDIPELGVTRGSLFAERIQIYFQVDDLVAKGLMKRNQDGSLEISDLGFMGLEKHHRVSREIQDFAAKAGHTL